MPVAPVPRDRGDARPGPRSPRLQRLRRLSTDRAARRAEGRFVIEGPVALADALAAGAAVEEIYLEPGASPGGVEPGAGAVIVEVAPDALRRVTDATTSRGVAAVVARRPATLADLPDGQPVLVLAGVADPGNAGTLLRSAEAAGFGGVVLTAGSVDPFAPKVVRSSAGSIHRIVVVDGGDAVAVLGELAAGGRRRVGTQATGATPYHRAELPGDVALVLGNEAHGLDERVGAAVDDWVSIPMAGRAESLNVAMAGTVLCFELSRRRG